MYYSEMFRVVVVYVRYLVRSLTPLPDLVVKGCTEMNDPPAFTGEFTCYRSLLCILCGTAPCIILDVSVVLRGCYSICPVLYIVCVSTAGILCSFAITPSKPTDCDPECRSRSH